MPTVEIEKGYKINYLDKGKGRNLVYIHGFLGCSWLYEDLVDYFSKKYRVIAIDHLGHGKSDKPESESYELIDLAKYVDQTLSKIIGDEKIVLHGHSMGGMIALTYATTPTLAKRLKGLVLMGTAANIPAILAIAAAYVLYLVYKKWNETKYEVQEESDPFVNFEKQWAELKRS